jgi:transcriptional regulator with GAF, ATPase, and Fis domain
MASSKTAMPSEALVSMTPAPADKHEALLREARDAADRLRLLLDISNTIVANLELEDLLHAVAASLRKALHCDVAAIAVADTQAGCLRFHAVDFPDSVGVARPGFMMPIEGTLLGEVFRTGKPTIHSHANGIGVDEVKPRHGGSERHRHRVPRD